MSILIQLKEYLTEALFPSDGRCAICSRLLLFERAPFCYSCISTVPYIRGRSCGKCGKLIGGGVNLCHDCTYVHHEYQQGSALFSYTKIGRRIIQEIKFEGNRRLAHWVGQEMGRSLLQTQWAGGIHLILPVPLHEHRQRERGFNQSLLLARGMVEILELPMEDHLLRRIKDTPHQTDLTRQERERNTKGAFRVMDPEGVVGKNILLVDDVYTTGATINACAKTLKAAGAKEIYFSVAAIGKDSGPIV